MTYITLLKPKGKDIETIRYLDEFKAPERITIKEVYFVFDQYEAVIIFGAMNDKTASNLIMIIGFSTNYTLETMVAISTKENEHRRKIYEKDRGNNPLFL